MSGDERKVTGDVLGNTVGTWREFAVSIVVFSDVR
jgi:hypothetical protein